MNTWRTISETIRRSFVVGGSITGSVAAAVGLALAFRDQLQWVVLAVVLLWAATLLAISAGRVGRIFIDRLGIVVKSRKDYVTTDLTFADVDNAIRILQDDLRKDNFIPDVIVGIDRGGSIVAGLLGKAMRLPSTHLSSAERWRISNPEASLDDGLKDLNTRRQERKNISRLLLVDDACRGGPVLSNARACLKGVNALQDCEIKTATILNEEHEIGGGREKPNPDFFVYKTEFLNIRLPWDRKVAE